MLEMIEREWKEALDKAVEVEGESFCHQAYEGYQNQGRGCIFVSSLLSVGVQTESCGLVYQAWSAVGVSQPPPPCNQYVTLNSSSA